MELVWKMPALKLVSEGEDISLSSPDPVVQFQGGEVGNSFSAVTHKYFDGASTIRIREPYACDLYQWARVQEFLCWVRRVPNVS